MPPELINQDEPALPFVSVVIPIRNEIKFLRETIDAVLNQDYPEEKMEVLVADGLSDDGTREILAVLQKSHHNFQVIDNLRGIASTGLNAAIKQAKGEYIVRVDGHTVIARDYVRQCIEALKSSGADNAGGKMNAVGLGRLGEGIAIATSTPFGVGGGRFHYSDKEEWVDTVYMGAWPRSSFERIGLFDEELVRDQDDELNYRLRKHGGRILLSPKIRSKYYPRNSLFSLGKQYFQYGFWKVRVFQKHTLQLGVRHFIPPAFAASLIFSALTGIFSSYGWWLLASILFTYTLVNLLISARLANKYKWLYFPYLVVIFYALHLSYGFGFLIGLFAFVNRWGDKQGKVPKIQIPVV